MVRCGYTCDPRPKLITKYTKYAKIVRKIADTINHFRAKTPRNINDSDGNEILGFHHFGWRTQNQNKDKSPVSIVDLTMI